MITLIHLLPSLLNLYGDGANLEVLKRELAAAGAEAQILPWAPGAADFSAAGLIYAGPGTEKRIEKALELLLPYKEARAGAKESGVPMLFCGTAAELAGATAPFERPADWGGFRLVPEEVEFWHGEANRLHRRLRYTLVDGVWRHEHLQP